jgi:hypothetical protein
MKLDRKEILKALETITIAGEGKNMVESGAVTNVVTLAMRLLTWFCIRRRCTSRKEQKTTLKKQSTT